MRMIRAGKYRDIWQAGLATLLIYATFVHCASSVDRILKGAEARVFVEALLNLLDEVILCDFDDYELGIKCFDTLTFGQKISVLTTIGNGLFRKDVKAYCLYTTLAAHRLP